MANHARLEIGEPPRGLNLFGDWHKTPTTDFLCVVVRVHMYSNDRCGYPEAASAVARISFFVLYSVLKERLLSRSGKSCSWHAVPWGRWCQWRAPGALGAVPKRSVTLATLVPHVNHWSACGLRGPRGNEVAT
jgi:hypothetical protein